MVAIVALLPSQDRGSKIQQHFLVITNSTAISTTDVSVRVINKENLPPSYGMKHESLLAGYISVFYERQGLQD